MRYLILLLAAALIGCAHTTVDTKTSKGATNHARFEGDMTNTTYTVSAEGAIAWHADTVNHAAATLAQGQSATSKITSVGTALLAVWRLLSGL